MREEERRRGPPATRSELFTRFGQLLKSPWRSPSEGDLQGEIDVCENLDKGHYGRLVGGEEERTSPESSCTTRIA